MKFAKGAVALVAAGLALTVTACGAPAASTTASAPASASGPVEITVWAWEPTLKDVVTAFQAANPDIKVNLQNVGGAGDTYTKLDNALAAGSGAPDVAQVEYYAIGQYAIPGKLADLTQFGAADLQSKFTTGTWNAVTQANSGKIYGLPVDSGPMALFYNKATFDKAGVTKPPATWEEFYQAAKKIHALGKNYYITTDNGDAGFATSMMWLAGAKPFGVADGQVTIDLGDAGVVSFAEFWQKMIDEGLINTRREVERKVGIYLGAGVALVWVVDPKPRTVSVHQPDRVPRVLGGDDVLEGGEVLPGFAVALAHLFG